MTRAQFYQKYYPSAYAATKDTGIFPELAIAQAALESGNGNSLLSSKYNNFFGIKDSAQWTGPTINLKTGEYTNGQYGVITDAFRVYTDPTQSFRDYVSFLKNNPRYTTAGVFAATNAVDQAIALERAGYSTSDQYAEVLQSIMAGAKKYIPVIAAAGGTALLLLFFLYLITHSHD